MLCKETKTANPAGNPKIRIVTPKRKSRRGAGHLKKTVKRPS
jgi:hypothetical protein